MDGARLQTVIHKGYRIAARNIGRPFTLYRPSSATSVIAVGNIVAVDVLASFASYGNQFQFGRPDAHEDFKNNGLFDADLVMVRDYLVGPVGTWFVASKEPIKPPLCVRCDRTVSVYRLGGDCGGLGLGSYGGATQDSEAPIMTGWPAAVQMQGKTPSQGDLPASQGGATFAVYLPEWPGVVLKASDIIRDDLGNRYAIQAVELGELGWQIRAAQMVT